MQNSLSLYLVPWWTRSVSSSELKKANKKSSILCLALLYIIPQRRQYIAWQRILGARGRCKPISPVDSCAVISILAQSVLSGTKTCLFVCLSVFLASVRWSKQICTLVYMR
uniref:Uncharacterized protein n=1 Tax=Arundo donax TaxID=35708 RepID=A0A0A8XQE3_ARUDO